MEIDVANHLLTCAYCVWKSFPRTIGRRRPFRLWRASTVSRSGVKMKRSYPDSCDQHCTFGRGGRTLIRRRCWLIAASYADMKGTAKSITSVKLADLHCWQAGKPLWMQHARLHYAGRLSWCVPPCHRTSTSDVLTRADRGGMLRKAIIALKARTHSEFQRPMEKCFLTGSGLDGLSPAASPALTDGDAQRTLNYALMQYGEVSSELGTGFYFGGRQTDHHWR